MDACCAGAAAFLIQRIDREHKESRQYKHVQYAVRNCSSLAPPEILGATVLQR